MLRDSRDEAVEVRRLLEVTDAQVRGLADLLIDCVDGGASVGFMHPLPVEKARAFWRSVAESVARGERALLVAAEPAGIIGTLHLAPRARATGQPAASR